MTNAILVMGAESSGNRLMLRILHAAGCAGKLHEDNSQDFESHLPLANGTPIAWLKTFPHAQEYPSLNMWSKQVKAAGYKPTFIVMLRDWFPMISSQVSVGHVATAERAIARSSRGLALIFEWLLMHEAEFVTVTYSGLVHHTKPLLTWLLPQLDARLQVPDIDVYDGDLKWWNTEPKPPDDMPGYTKIQQPI